MIIASAASSDEVHLQSVFESKTQRLVREIAEYVCNVASPKGKEALVAVNGLSTVTRHMHEKTRTLKVLKLTRHPCMIAARLLVAMALCASESATAALS